MKHTIDIKLNCTGFSGSDAQDLLPDFITERETTVGLSWYPSVNGPESFNITVVIYGALGVVGAAFLNELSKDLYEWGKQKLLKCLKRKRYPICYISIKFEKIEVFFGGQDLFDDPNAAQIILSFFESLPSLLTKIEEKESECWQAYKEDGSCEIKIRPFKNNWK